MKLIDEAGNEHEFANRTTGYALIKSLTPDHRNGVRPGDHVEETNGGAYRYKFQRDRKVYYGPSRGTEDEAKEDFRRVLAGDPLAPLTPKRASEEAQRKATVGRGKTYAAKKAASPDGAVHIGAPTCGFCKVTGHRASYCPERRAMIEARATKSTKGAEAWAD